MQIKSVLPWQIMPGTLVVGPFDVLTRGAHSND